MYTLANSIEPKERENIKKLLIVFLETDSRYNFKYNFLTHGNKMWVINHFSSGKGVLPYEMIKKWEDLNEKPTVEHFFPKTHFCSSLKNSIISDDEYEDIKKLFNLFKMCTLSDLNALYNFQGTIILTEIFENRIENMQQKFKFNPRKCSSASTLSGAIQRDMSKVIISLPTNTDVIELMEETLIGGMSVVNSRIGLDSNLFTKNNNQKLVYKVKNKESNQIENKRISTKILKMDKNGQYGNAMTKPLPTGCIKKSLYTVL